MKGNINKVIERGERLDNIEERSGMLPCVVQHIIRALGAM
jgi:hypothetical protein